MLRKYAQLPAIFGLLAVLLAGCDRSKEPPQADTPPGTPVAALTLSERDLFRRVRVSAPVQAQATIRLASRTDGTVQTVLKEEGDMVTAGELLAGLETAEQRAELRRAAAEEERAQLEYDRIQTLRERDTLSATEYQRALADLHIATSVRELWQARVDFGRILAPRDAVVTSRLIEPGEAVNAQDALFHLAALDRLVVRAGLSEMDVVHIVQGQAAPVRFDALPDIELTGTVRRIFPAADPVSRLVMVEVALPPDATDRGIKPGFLARVTFDVDRHDGVLALPSAIIGSDGGEIGRYVFVIEDGTLKQRPVSVGVIQDGWTEITEGLWDAETVLASNPIDMRDGQRVRIVQYREPK